MALATAHNQMMEEEAIQTLATKSLRNWRKRFLFLFLLPLISLLLFGNLESSLPLFKALLGSDLEPAIISLQNLIKNNSQGFFALLFIGIYFEYISSPREVYINNDSILEISDHLRRPALGTSSAKQLESYIANLYPGTDTKSLSKNIISNKSVMLDMDVELEIHDCEIDNECINYISKVSFRTNLDGFLIALASDTHDQELAAKIPTVQFSRALPKSFSCQEDADRYARSIYIEAVDEKSTNLLSFSRVSKKDTAKILKSAGYTENNKIHLYKIQGGVEDNKRINLIFPVIRLRKDCHYVYWFADRALFIRKIVMDASNLKSFQRSRFNLQCNILSARSFNASYKDTGKSTVLVEDWITYGQGIIFSWR